MLIFAAKTTVRNESCTTEPHRTDERKVSNQTTTCPMKTEEQGRTQHRVWFEKKKTCSPLYNQGKSILFEFSLLRLDFIKNLKKKDDKFNKKVFA